METPAPSSIIRESHVTLGSPKAPCHASQVRSSRFCQNRRHAGRSPVTRLLFGPAVGLGLAPQPTYPWGAVGTCQGLVIYSRSAPVVSWRAFPNSAWGRLWSHQPGYAFNTSLVLKCSRQAQHSCPPTAARARAWTTLGAIKEGTSARDRFWQGCRSPRITFAQSVSRVTPAKCELTAMLKLISRMVGCSTLKSWHCMSRPTRCDHHIDAADTAEAALR